jgi:site-specific recombinase XerD
MKDVIRDPVKVDAKKRVISGKGEAHRWLLNVPASITGKTKERLFFRTETAAKSRRDTLLEARKAAGDDLLVKLKERGMSVAQAINYALKHAPRATPVTIEKAVAAFLASRKAANCKPRYLANLKSQLAQVETEFKGVMVDTITKAQVQRFIGDLTGKDRDTPASPKSRINYIITLTALFNFAVEEGWRGDTPTSKIRRPELDEALTSILSPAQTKKLIEEASKPENHDVFPALLIQLFAAPRRSEIPHITWDLIRDSYLRLDKTKVRIKRAVELPQVLIDWLAPYRKTQGRVFAPVDVHFDPKDTRPIEDSFTYRLGQVAEIAEISLPKNVLRHTAITYRVASTGDINSTALWAGNSVKVIREHYLGAATKDEAMTFYALRPAAGSNVISITQTAK